MIVVCMDGAQFNLKRNSLNTQHFFIKLRSCLFVLAKYIIFCLPYIGAYLSSSEQGQMSTKTNEIFLLFILYSAH